MNNKKILLLGFFFIIFNYIFVGAVAVSGVYTNERPLEISPGEEKEVVLILQNGGKDDVKFIANITKGNEIASFIDKNREYLVPSGANNVTVKLRVKVPENAVRNEYEIGVVFEPIPIGNAKGGMVQIEIGLSRYFKVIVTGEAEKKEKEEGRGKIIEAEPIKDKEISLVWAIIGFIIIIILIIATLLAYSLFKRRRDIGHIKQNLTNF